MKTKEKLFCMFSVLLSEFLPTVPSCEAMMLLPSNFVLKVKITFPIVLR